MKKSSKLNAMIEFFNRHSIKFMDAGTGDEILPDKEGDTIICPYCENETARGKKCGWCLNNLPEKK